MIDPKMVEVIGKWSDDMWTVTRGPITLNDLAQRLHDAGYRMVPSVREIFVEIAGKCATDESAKMASELVHDLMMGEK
jgi:hypothetical protein